MGGWDPREEMGLLRYLKFKLRFVGTGIDAARMGAEGQRRILRGVHRKIWPSTLDVEKVYTGDSLEYKIYYRTVGAPGEIEEEYYTRIK